VLLRGIVVGMYIFYVNNYKYGGGTSRLCYVLNVVQICTA
jgi:hypothetical protein